MSNNAILFEIRDKIGYITINRPEKLNSLTKETLMDMEVLLSSLREDPECKSVIITGAGDKAFTSGADLDTFLKGREKAMGIEWSRSGQRLFAMFDELGKPTIAALNGLTLGGGLEIALACTFRFACPEARLGFPEITLGFIPGWGGTQRLPRLIGKANALELILTGDIIDAEKALGFGLVNRIVPRHELMKTCEEIAQKIAKNAPLAIRFAMEAVNEGLNMPLKEGLILESTLAPMSCLTEDAEEGINAFLEKRKPDFKGR